MQNAPICGKIHTYISKQNTRRRQARCKEEPDRKGRSTMKKLEQIYEGKAKKEDQAVEQAIKNASYEIPDAMVDTQISQMANDFAQRIQSQGLTMEQYYQFTGMTEEKMNEEFKPQAVKRIETRLVLEAIAKAENIEISDEKLDEEIAKMAEAYKMEADKLKEFMGDAEKKQMKEDIAVQDAVTLIVDASVEG